MSEGGGREAGLRVRAPAKVNLYFELVGRREDGFHEIRTVMQAVSLFDELGFSLRPDGRIGLTCSHPEVPCDENNLVVQAGRLLQQRYGVRQGAAIRLHKRIPLGGGLGGGSSDCAIALRALCELWGLDARAEHLAEMAAQLGSDVPFFLCGGAALCEGRGERVSSLPCAGRMHYVLVMPSRHVSTARVYAAVQTGLTTRGRGSNNVHRALSCGDAQLLALSLRNDLQAPALALYPDLCEVWDGLEELKTSCNIEGVALSGSGSSFFVVTGSERSAKRLASVVQSALTVPCAAVHSIPAWGRHLALLTC